MIDTDKYKGHTEGPWDANAPLGIYLKVGQTISAADAQLIADAPLLLEEVKRLREENDKLVKAVEEDNKILKKHIGIIGEIHFLEWAGKTHPVWLDNLKEGYKRHKEAKKNEIKE